MKRLVRVVSVLVLVLALAMAAVPAFASASDCPDVYISTDGGQTWSQCDFNGGVEIPGWLICFYTCYI